MHVNTSKSRVTVEPSAEVKILREKVSTLEAELAEVKKRIPAEKPASEGNK